MGGEAISVRSASMTELITPKNSLEDLLRGMTPLRSLKRLFYRNHLQKWFGIVTLAALGAQILALIAFKWIIQAPLLGDVFVISWAVSLFSVMGYQVAGTVPLFRIRAVLDPVIGSFNAEIDLIAHLAHTYESRHLEYAQDCLTLLVQHLRSRFAWLVGALDKVGLLPRAIMAYFSYPKILGGQKQDLSTSPYIDWTWGLSAFVVTIYLGATYFFSIAQQLDRFCVVLKHAVQAKKFLIPADHIDAQGKPAGERPTVLSRHNL
jgi:hypothetical protein